MITEAELTALLTAQTQWQDRYRLLIQLSKQLPYFEAQFKTVENQVQGCENKVWLMGTKQNDNRWYFSGDSEGRIVKGLLAILLILVNQKKADDILTINLFDFFKQNHTLDGLSDSRQLGLTKLIERINTIITE